MKNQIKSSFCIAVACAAVLSVFISSSAYGWGKKTHEKLTGQVIENPQVTGWLEPYLQNNLGFKKDVDELLPYRRLGWFKRSKQTKIKDILTDGAQQEDAWPFPPYPYTSRARNHFHNPLKDLGQSGFPGGESALAWARGAVRA